MIYAVAIAYLLVFVATASYFAKRDGYFSVVTVFGLASFYYYFAIPLELTLTNETEVTATAWMSYAVYPEEARAIGIMSVLALLGFATGYRWSGFRLIMDPTPIRGKVSPPMVLTWLAVGGMSLLCMQYGIRLILTLGNYYEGTEFRHASPIINAVLQYTVLMLAITGAVLVQGTYSQRITGLGLIVTIALWGLYTADKNPICLAACALGTAISGEQSRRPAYLFLIAASFYIAVLGLPVFSAFRAQANISLAETLNSFRVVNTDARGPMASLALTVQNEDERYWGGTYALALECLLPQALHPNRPDDLAQRFAYDYIPAEVWVGGMGMGYSLLAEAYLNFGIAGGFIQYCLLGLLSGLTLRGLRHFLSLSFDDALLRAFYCCTTIMMVILMHRGATNQVGRILIYYCIAPAVICFLSRMRSNTAQSFSNESTESSHARPLAT